VRAADDGVHQLEGITRSAKKALRYLYFQEDEHPITAQLFGANPAVMAEAAKMVEDLGTTPWILIWAARQRKW